MSGQGGFVLISSLILLMMLTLIGAAMVNLGTVNLRIINNTQRQMEARSVAQRVIDGIISANFAKNEDTLTAVFTGSPYTVALADDTYKSYQVSILERPCMQQFRLFASDDPRTAIDSVANECVGPYCLCQQGGSSFCADTLWRIRAEVSEGWFGANEGVVQGVSLVVDIENNLYQYGLDYESEPKRSSADSKNPYCH
jgi:hypothetical protein